MSVFSQPPLWRRWSVALLLLAFSSFSGLLHAESEPAQASSPATSKAEAALNRVNGEIRDLSESLKVTTGDQKDAIQFRLFNKNNELREVIGNAIDADSLPKEMLIEQVKVQQNYTESAKAYLDSKAEEVTEKFNAAKDEDKLSILNNYSEIQDYLNSAYDASWQNLEWLKKLDVPDKVAESEFAVLVGKKLRLTSASIEYFSQQANALSTQIASAPEADKAGLQTSQLILKQRLSIETKSLRNLIVLATN
ncbi:small-conductance mechanosensitive channel [Vibrio variabilis]|uniref:Small-conductance mechanosensitive channel n=1 Tax=Vibrio variabilis TaxID=990271 RepID=A0ABQ0JB44_9VIBR|nr:small-conductance mechanosensitive channel [Vibrio variabilis]